MPTVNDFLEMMVERDASDLFFSVGTPLHIKIDGIIKPINPKPLTSQVVTALAKAIMSEKQQAHFAKHPEMNLGMDLEGKGRFRINIFRQRGNTAIVIRYLKDRIPTIEELNLPQVLKKLAMKKRGMILEVGATGAGKSTTLASMIDYRNENTRCHILSVEDPIEYVHRYKKSIVNQREVGIDTDSYDDALKNAMREAPDVILIGEVRERSTMQHAIAYAETGHLCLSTLHASNANHALERIINFFPETMHPQVFSDLAHNLAAIVSQRLVVNADGRRVPAVEVMIITPLIKDLIRKGRVDEVREVMEKSSEPGMQTYDQSLFQLYKDGIISEEMAMENAESTSNLGVRIRLYNGLSPESELVELEQEGQDEG